MGRNAQREASARRGGARAGAGRPRAAEADEHILEACLALLEDKGYGGLSIDAVAAAAGVAKTTIYRRWPSKPALVEAAARPLYASQVEAPDTGRLRDDLVHLLAGSRELMTGRAGRVLQILVRESAAHPELDEPVQASIYRRRKLYHHVLVRAVARGELRANVDLDLVTDLLLGPLWTRTLITPTPTPPELVREIVDAVLRGVSR